MKINSFKGIVSEMFKDGEDSYIVRLYLTTGVEGLNGRHVDTKMNSADILQAFGMNQDDIDRQILEQV